MIFRIFQLYVFAQTDSPRIDNSKAVLKGYTLSDQ